MRCLTVFLALALVCCTSAWGAETINGTATYRERIALPPGAVFEAVLEDVSLTDAPPVELGRTAIADPGTPPIGFSISYDPAKAKPGGVFAVRAQISVGRKIIFVSDKMHPVPIPGDGADVDIWMIKVGDTAKEAQEAPTLIGAHGLRLPATFLGDLPCDGCQGVRYWLNLWPDQVFYLRRSWRGTRVERDAIGRWSVDPDERALSLRVDGEDLRFAILGPERIGLMAPQDQNDPDATPPLTGELRAQPVPQAFEPHLGLRGMLTYEANSARFTECLTGRDFVLAELGDYTALEHAYLAAGAEAGGPIMASFDGVIEDRGSASKQPSIEVERFVGVWPGETCERAGGPASLTNTYWKILRLGGTEVVTGEGRREPNLMLRQDDTRFSATVGCNQFAGRYSVDGDRLRFEGVAGTRMACTPALAAWEEQFQILLNTVTSFRIDGQTLELFDAAGKSLGLFQAVYLY